MTSSPPARSLSFWLIPLCVGLLALLAFRSEASSRYPSSAQDSSQVQWTWSAGRETPYTQLDAIESDLKPKRVGEIVAGALESLAGEPSSWTRALRSVEAQFASVVSVPKGTKYCYEYDPATGTWDIICKEERIARIIANPGDHAVVLHFTWTTVP